MPSPTADFFSLFIVPPGDLLYYLAVFALGQVSLFLAFGHRLRRQRERAPRIYTTAALTIVFVWLILMVGALVALLSGQGADALLPPMERLAHTVTILVLAWAFLTAESERWGRASNLVALVFTATVILAYVATGIEWLSVYTTADFNLSAYAAAWAFLPTLIAALSIILLLMDARRVADTPLKLVTLAVIVLGFGGTLAQMLNESIIGDYAGGSRLAFVAAMLLLPVVIYRAVVASFERELYDVQEQSRQIRARILSERPAVSPAMMSDTEEPTLNAPERESGQLMKALGLMLEKAAPENIAEQVVTASLTVLKGDVGALLTIDDPNYADIRVGIDRVMNRAINGISLHLDDQPTLQNAIERRMQRVLHVERNADELRDLYTRLDIEQSGPTYFQPLISNRRLIGVLLIGMPYAGREISDSELELLKAIGIIGGNLLALGDSTQVRAQEGQAEMLVPVEYVVDERETTMSETMAGLRSALETQRDQIVALNTQITQMKLELDDERSQVALSLGDTDEGKSVSQRILTLNEEHQQMMDERERLSNRLREAETALASAYTDDNTSIFKTMIEVLGRERDELVAQRERLQTQLVQVRNAQGRENGVPLPNMVREMLERITEEKARTELERDQLGERLEQIESQLTALGIPGGAAGLTQIISGLYEQRAALQARFDALKSERDSLVGERAQFQVRLEGEKDRENRLHILQADLKHLASDREAVTKQREKLRAERQSLIERLDTLKEQHARQLAETAGFEQELAETHEEQNALRMQIEGLANERATLASERDRLVAERQALEMERDGLLARFEGDRERLQQLGVDGVGALTRMIDELSEGRAHAEREMNETRTQLAATEDRLEILQIRASSIQTQIVYRPDNPDMFLSMIEELRTPMTSVVGYVDLILNESAGILGEMQRKFMMRVSSNVSRLATMLDDLVRLSYLDTGRFRLERQPIDVIEIIEDVITASSPQLREKGLSLSLDLEDEAEPLTVDKDAITQVIGQLVTNAYLVSPPNGEIVIRARREATTRHNLKPDAEMDYGSNGHRAPVDALVISISDQGGGILPEDMPRAFARKYKAENPLIQGLGDTGVGLALARALVEAHGGEVWLETAAGVGTQFTFTLPYAVMPLVQIPHWEEE